MNETIMQQQLFKLPIKSILYVVDQIVALSSCNISAELNIQHFNTKLIYI